MAVIDMTTPVEEQKKVYIHSLVDLEDALHFLSDEFEKVAKDHNHVQAMIEKIDGKYRVGVLANNRQMGLPLDDTKGT